MRIAVMLALLSILFCHASHSQNLVPNPGFENMNCPTGYTGFPAQIATYVADWYSATCASPDPYSECGTTTGPNRTMVPNVIFGYQYARQGNRFLGFGFYGSWMEYIGVRLTEPLEAGETYHVSYWVACADNMMWAADQIGVYFSNSEIRCYSGFNGDVLNLTPQVVNPVGNFLTDTLWQQVSGDFVAAGGEEYLVLGYFKNPVVADFHLFPDPGNGLFRKANPTYQPTVQATGNTGFPRVYYYIDDVAVQKATTLPVRLSGFQGRLQDQKVALSWATTLETNNCRFEVERSANGSGYQKIGDVAGAKESSSRIDYRFIDEHPATGTAYYRLRQVDCDGKFVYSKVIVVRNDASGFNIYPNPVNSELTIDRNRDGAGVVSVFDMSGKMMLRQTVTYRRETLPVTTLLPGQYIIRVDSDYGTYSQKFLKQ